MIGTRICLVCSHRTDTHCLMICLVPTRSRINVRSNTYEDYNVASSVYSKTITLEVVHCNDPTNCTYEYSLKESYDCAIATSKE